MEEIWKNIEGYEGLYECSNYGNIKSLAMDVKMPNGGLRHYDERILKPRVDKYGYLYINLSKNGKIKTFKIHRLVAQTFLDNPNNLPCVNHKDENKLNNIPENLEYCTVAYNNSYGTRTERMKRFGKNHHRSKSILQIDKDTDEIIREWDSGMDIQRELGYSQTNISACCRGIYNQAYGFKWRYSSVS